MAYNRWLYRNPNLYKVTFKKKKICPRCKISYPILKETIYWSTTLDLMTWEYAKGYCCQRQWHLSISLYLSLAQTARFPCSKLPKLTGVGTASLYLKHPLLYQFPCLLFSLFCEDPFWVLTKFYNWVLVGYFSYNLYLIFVTLFCECSIGLCSHFWWGWVIWNEVVWNGFCMWIWYLKSIFGVGVWQFDYISIFLKMALQPSEIKEEVALDVGKSKRKNKKDGGEVAESGCWSSTFKFFGSLLSSKSKVDSSLSGPTAHSGNPMFP